MHMAKATRRSVGIRHAFERAVAEARLLLQPPLGEADVAVHEARTRVKRARAYLSLLRKQLGESVFAAVNAELRRAAHTLAALREPVARLDALNDLPALAKAEFASIREDLRREHERATEPHALARLASEAERHLNVALCGREHERPAHAAQAAPRVRRALCRSRRKARRALREAHDEPSAEHLHALRRSTKRYQYQSQVLAGLRAAPRKKQQKRIARLSKLLGRHHDLALLERELALSTHGLEAFALARLRSSVNERVAELRDRSLALAKRVYERR